MGRSGISDKPDFRRRHADGALRRSEQELADLFNQASVGLNLVGADGVIVEANRAELELLGYSRAEYLGRRIADFHIDPGALDEMFSRLRGGQEIHNYPARLRGKDGILGIFSLTQGALPHLPRSIL